MFRSTRDSKIGPMCECESVWCVPYRLEICPGCICSLHHMSFQQPEWVCCLQFVPRSFEMNQLQKCPLHSPLHLLVLKLQSSLLKIFTNTIRRDILSDLYLCGRHQDRPEGIFSMPYYLPTSVSALNPFIFKPAKIISRLPRGNIKMWFLPFSLQPTCRNIWGEGCKMCRFCRERLQEGGCAGWREHALKSPTKGFEAQR